MTTDWKAEVFRLTIVAQDSDPCANVLYESEAVALVERAFAEGKKEGLQIAMGINIQHEAPAAATEAIKALAKKGAE